MNNLTIKLTENETIVFNAIVNSDYNEGAKGDIIWGGVYWHYMELVGQRFVDVLECLKEKGLIDWFEHNFGYGYIIL